METWREFEAEGWEPPEPPGDRGLAVELLAEPRTWAQVAHRHGETIGHVAFYPARERTPDGRSWSNRPALPGLAHLWQLFVVPSWQGRGLADALHGAAIEEMRRQGYVSARLYTPARNPRSRAFYERRGWVAGIQGWHRPLGLALVEYRLALRERP